MESGTFIWNQALFIIVQPGGVEKCQEVRGSWIFVSRGEMSRSEGLTGTVEKCKRVGFHSRMSGWGSYPPMDRVSRDCGITRMQSAGRASQFHTALPL